MFVYGSDDALFGCIEDSQGSRPFGDFLDAGTGIHSLRWIATLNNDEKKGMTSLTAITADKNMQRNVQKEALHLGMGDDAHILIGNWFPPTNDNDASISLPLKQYDTILADYLIGAMDGFSPFRQDEMIPKLVKLLNPNGGRLYIVGLEPLPDSVPNNPNANIITKVRQVRDACILLAGHRCYREYPLEWIHKQVQQSSELTLIQTNQFPILYRYQTIKRQIDVARSKFPFFSSRALRESMKLVLDDLDEQAKRATSSNSPITLGFDYVVAVERRRRSEETTLS